MRIHTDFQSIKGIEHPVLTIGTFDGVHLGHQAIIQRLKEIATRTSGETVLLTFYPHPRMVLHPEDHELKLLNSPEEKAQLLGRAGIQHLVIYPFSEDFSRLSAFDYVRDLIVNGINAETVVVGYDHRFGRNREGDFPALRDMSEVFGFSVEEISARDIDAVHVSSTKIRDSLIKGDVSKAARLLGYNYKITGTVVHGDGRGSTIGFPTANLRINYPYKLIPARGVYAVIVELNDQHWKGVLNIGIRPTVHSNGSEQIEVYIMDFDQTIYGENVSLHFISRVRDEQKFGSIDDLKKQIAADIVTARNSMLNVL